MRAYVRNKLGELGITSKSYVLVKAKNGRLVEHKREDADDEILLPEIWGITMEMDDKIVAVIEYEPGEYGAKGMYYLRPKKGDRKNTISRHKLQRTAIAEFIRLRYNLA